MVIEIREEQFVMDRKPPTLKRAGNWSEVIDETPDCNMFKSNNPLICVYKNTSFVKLNSAKLELEPILPINVVLRQSSSETEPVVDQVPALQSTHISLASHALHGLAFQVPALQDASDGAMKRPEHTMSN